jgi:hypothetical protein
MHFILSGRLAPVSFAVLAAFSACRKTTTNAATFAGHYKGTVLKIINTTDTSSKDWELQLLPTTTYDQLEIVPSILVTSQIQLQGNQFSISPVSIGTNAEVQFFEYGRGYFTGNSFIFELHQDQLSLNTGNLVTAVTWKGALHKH